MVSVGKAMTLVIVDPRLEVGHGLAGVYAGILGCMTASDTNSSWGRTLRSAPSPSTQESRQAILPRGLSPAAPQAWRSASASTMVPTLQIDAAKAAVLSDVAARICGLLLIAKSPAALNA